MLRINPIYSFIFGNDLDEDYYLTGLRLPKWIESYEIYIFSGIGYIVMTLQLHFVNWFVKKHALLITSILEQN